MTGRVVIIDYGSGNLRSAAKAFERAVAEAGLDMTVTVSSDAEVVRRGDHIVLPGVGAFGDCRRALDNTPGMIDALEERVFRGGQPFLGICVGLQLLATWGREHGNWAGFRWIGGEVVPIEPDDLALKVPHMGWNELVIDMPQHPLVQGLEDGAHAYFVHSYKFRPGFADSLVAHVDYGGTIPAILAARNMAGTQFHPEKSQATGLRLITNFLNWRP